MPFVPDKPTSIRKVSAGREYDPSEGGGTLQVGAFDTWIETPEWVERALAGTGRGIANVGRHAANLIGLESDEDLKAANELDQPLMNTTAGKVGNFIGETAVTAPLMMGATMGAARASAGAAKTLANPIARGVTEGAMHGGLMADPGDKVGGMLVGGAMGGVLPAAGGAVSKAARGLKRTPDAQRLLNEGVALTPGQMNPGGMWSQLEETWQSLPLVGPAITAARDNAKSSFQRRVIQEGAAPGANIARGEVANMLDDAYKSFQPLYDQAKGFPVLPKIMSANGPDVPITAALHSAATHRGVRATDETRKSVLSWLKNQITQPLKSSDDYLAMRSNIRAEARSARLQGDPAAAALLDKADEAVTATIESQLPQQARTVLRTADAKYGTYKIIEDAVARAKDMPGGFTASKLAESVAQNVGKGTGKGAYARGGGGPLRDLASAGTATLNVRVPQTGARIAAIGIPAMGIAATPSVGVPIIGGMLGLTATETGRRLAAGTTKAQQLAQALLQRGRPADPYAAIMAEYLRRGSVTAALPRE